MVYYAKTLTYIKVSNMLSLPRVYSSTSLARKGCSIKEDVKVLSTFCDCSVVAEQFALGC